MLANSTVNNKMLVLAREYRGISQHDLAKKLSVTQGTLSKYELGILLPSEGFLMSLGKQLNVPLGFFKREGDIFPPNLYYRRTTKASKKILTKAEAEMNIYRLNIQRLLKSIEIEGTVLPIFDIESFGTPEIIARKLRQLWKIPLGPINNLFELIERKSIIIVQCDFDSQEIAGRSMYTDDKHPIIYLNKNMPMDRKRFTLAHELFHLIAHVFTVIDHSRDVEKEANLFAGEFLVPSEDLEKHLFKNITIEHLADLKRYYKVAMQSLLIKITKDKPLSKNQARYLWATFSKLGLRKQEPPELEPPIESPVFLYKMIDLFQNELGYSDEEIDNVLTLKSEEWKEKYLSNNKTKLKLVI